MNRADFDKLVLETQKVTGDLLIAKGAEYAGDGDRLINFKRNAIKNGQTVLETWQTYWGKHVDSINTYMARVKDRAVHYALVEVVEEDLAARVADDGVKRHKATDPVEFRKRIDRLLPMAMRTVDSELSEAIEGRFHDNMNYSILCIALLKELREVSGNIDQREKGR